ncbi:MAG TPA: IPT/TIG domain-containing protein [Ferruginibacter sp.]|nr:IPT/TIG domain-containing protein [Ferruginibacter sp.]
MKKIKNATLAICGSFLLLCVATMSCHPHHDAPTVTVTGAEPNPAITGDTVTVSGTNFTSPATVSIDGGEAIPATVSADGKTLTFVAPAAVSGVLSVTTNGQTKPLPGNFVVGVAGPTSDSVATTALVAKWTFDSNGSENISGNSPYSTIGTVDYSSAGKIGHCATFTNGALLFDPITQINNDTSLESYSISLWANFSASTGAEQLRSLFQMTGTKYANIWGQLDLELTNSGIVGDSLTIGARQHQQDGHIPPGPTPYDHEGFTATNQGGVTGKWVFLTETYNGNGTNQTMQLYLNGSRIDSAEFANVTKPETFNLVPPGNYPTDGLAPATKVYIGSMAFFDRGNSVGDGYTNYAPNMVDRPWAGGDITGKLDDIRVFKRALTVAEVDSLYARGSRGL